MNYAAIERPLVTPVHAPSSESDGYDPALTRLRVVIVEDEAVLAMDMEDSLTLAGFEVVAIADSESEAVALVNRHRPDLVLMDITLRHGSGLAAAAAIAGQASIIFVSASSDPATLAAAEALKPLGFIRKPYVGHELPGLVNRILRA